MQVQVATRLIEQISSLRGHSQDVEALTSLEEQESINLSCADELVLDSSAQEFLRFL